MVFAPSRLLGVVKHILQLAVTPSLVPRHLHRYSSRSSAHFAIFVPIKVRNLNLFSLLQ